MRKSSLACRRPREKRSPLLIELVGQRRIDATDALLKAVDHPDATIRRAALTALGETVGLEGIPVLLAQIVVRENSAGFASLDGQPTEVAQALAKNSAEAKVPNKLRRPVSGCRSARNVRRSSRRPCRKRRCPRNAALLEILGAMGGNEGPGDGRRRGEESPIQKLQDTGTRLLGDWMTADAAPVLLDLVKNSHEDKYQLRACADTFAWLGSLSCLRSSVRKCARRPLKRPRSRRSKS